MTTRTGNITVNSSDVFPIIKKWLYSEHDIFMRELVANATDAINKRETLLRTENQNIPDPSIKIELDKEKRTISVTDNGVGMTEDEVVKYLAQLAFSGAEEFINKMKEAGNDPSNDIIGKFGLGFYSSFMVAEKVEVDSLSYQKGAKPIKWICEGDTEYSFLESDMSEVGTRITLHVGKDGEEFLDYWKLHQTLRNHCRFMPYPIFLSDLKEEKKQAESKDEGQEKKGPTQINETQPLWKRDPKELKDEDYLAFYRQLFPADQDPLFWLHLKVDHPFTLEGILYFPKLNPHRPFNESNIMLFCRQVFVSDSVKNIIPDFLSLLKGTIDSVDIPLNVSRSSLQGDPNIRKISNYIVKKVSESLKKLYKNDREKYESIWEDIGLFVKYGIISDGKFDESMREMVIFKNSEKKYVTLPEYRASIPECMKEKIKDKVLYFEREMSNNAVRMQLLSEGVHAVETDNHIDPHFMQHIEMHKKGEEEWKFVSVESDIENILETENSNEDDLKIKDLYSKFLVGEVKDDKKEENSLDVSGLEIEIKKIKNSTFPAYFKVDEQMKRFHQMATSMGQNGQFPLKKTLIINPNNTLIQNSLRLWEKGENPQLVEKICHHIQDLATISSEGLKNEEKENFVQRSQQLIQDLTTFAL